MYQGLRTIAIIAFFLAHISSGFQLGEMGRKLKVLSAGIAYAIWAGVGISMVAILSFVLFKQSLSTAQMAFIGLILTGAVGLNLTTTH